MNHLAVAVAAAQGDGVEHRTPDAPRNPMDLCRHPLERLRHEHLHVLPGQHRPPDAIRQDAVAELPCRQEDAEATPASPVPTHCDTEVPRRIMRAPSDPAMQPHARAARVVFYILVLQVHTLLERLVMYHRHGVLRGSICLRTRTRWRWRHGAGDFFQRLADGTSDGLEQSLRVRRADLPDHVRLRASGTAFAVCVPLCASVEAIELEAWKVDRSAIRRHGETTNPAHNAATAAHPRNGHRDYLSGLSRQRLLRAIAPKCRQRGGRRRCGRRRR
mmetsp:Transcript_8191/g.23374  ORF Transcript_8191/g.23374 Transcript_8191/m.23374 type:complete len:274 (-) Transcript_8191:1132-1953(-)